MEPKVEAEECGVEGGGEAQAEIPVSSCRAIIFYSIGLHGVYGTLQIVLGFLN